MREREQRELVRQSQSYCCRVWGKHYARCVLQSVNFIYLLHHVMMWYKPAASRDSGGICNHWTGLLDWITGLKFQCTKSIFNTTVELLGWAWASPELASRMVDFSLGRAWVSPTLVSRTVDFSYIYIIRCTSFHKCKLTLLTRNVVHAEFKCGRNIENNTWSNYSTVL